MSAAVPYRIEPGSIDSDRAAILALWNEGLAQNGMPEAKLDWYYRGNPEGPPAVLFLRLQGVAAPIGVAALGRRRMRRGGQTFEAGALADFVVSAAHRSFFPALYLQRAMLTFGTGDRAMVFGLPNPQSEAVVQRAGYVRIGNFVRYVRVVHSGEYFRRHVPAWLARPLGAVVDRLRHWYELGGRAGGLRARWSEGLPEGLDALWARTAEYGEAIGVRDARFLEWRFVRCPFHRYRFLALHRGSSGALCAYAVCLERERALEVCDFLADRRDPEAVARLWTEVAIEAYRRGKRSATVEFLGAAAVRNGLDESGWVARDRRALFAAFADESREHDPEHWYFTPADEDA